MRLTIEELTMDILSRVSVGLPSRDELIAASALLAACPRLSRHYDPEDVAVSEYCYYSTQTYIFEVVGFQLLGEMASALRGFDVVHELARQAREDWASRPSSRNQGEGRRGRAEGACASDLAGR
jgi:hypothetical protein